MQTKSNQNTIILTAKSKRFTIMGRGPIFETRTTKRARVPNFQLFDYLVIFILFYYIYNIHTIPLLIQLQYQTNNKYLIVSLF